MPPRQAPKRQKRKISSAAEFRRLAHSKGNLRSGIGAARELVDWAAVPSILAQLMQTPVIRKSLVANPFPRTMPTVRPFRPLPAVSPEVEYVWTAAILSAFVPELNSFVDLRNKFDDAYLGGFYDEASSLLDEAQRQFGFSFWLIDNRIRLFQQVGGIAQQKVYLEELIRDRGTNAFVAYMAFYFSHSCEENTSVSDLTRSLEQLRAAGVAPEIVDYFRFHTNPFDRNSVESPASCLNLEENSSLIDRLETFVSMAQLEMVRAKEEPPAYLATCFRLLSHIQDVRLQRAAWAINGPPEMNREFRAQLAAYDLYTSGKYDASLALLIREAVGHPAACENLELLARAHVYSGRAGFALPLPDSALVSRIASGLSSLFRLDSDFLATRFELQKLAILARTQQVSHFLNAALSRSHWFVSVGKHSEADGIWALSSSPANPWYVSVLDNMSGAPAYTPGTRLFLESTTMRLHSALTGGFEAELDLDSLELPEHRRYAYKGHAAMVAGMFGVAVEAYRRAIAEGTELVMLHVSRPLYEAYYAQDHLKRCMQLVFAAYRRNINSVHMFPVGALLRRYRALFRGPQDPLLYAVVLELYQRHVDTTFGRELSDAYDDVLDAYGTTRPFEVGLRTDVDAALLVHFLRYVAVVRVLEDSTAFPDYSAVEHERIAVLQQLLELDPHNKGAYEDEIAALTRGAAVSELLKAYSASKIYVDEDGILRSVEGELRDGFSRYHSLLASPEMEYRTVDIANRIKQLLKQADMDIRDWTLPATERESLFANMYDVMLTAFVFHPQFGFRTYLSARILHGTLEGRLRAALTARGFMFPESDQGVYATAEEFWNSLLADSDHDGRHRVLTRIAAFSKRVSAAIVRVRDRRIRVRSDDCPNGLFDFEPSLNDVRELMATVSLETTYEQFSRMLLDSVWAIVDRSLRNIVDELDGPFRRGMLHSFEALGQEIEGVQWPQRMELVDELTRARTEFLADLDEVITWFRRERHLDRPAFSFDTVLDVALSVTNNALPRTPVKLDIDMEVSTLLRGSTLEAFVEVLSNCFRNAVQHSGIEGRPPRMALEARSRDGVLTISIWNEVGQAIDFEARREALQQLLAAESAQSDLQALSREGGTGLRKIFRSLRHDLHVTPDVEVSVSRDGFQVLIRIPEEMVREDRVSH